MDNIQLRKILESYRTYSLELIYSLEKEDYDILEELLNKRQVVIEEINNIQYTKEEFSKIAEELQILVYQKRLSDLMIKKRGKVKEEINRMSNAKNANYSYNSRLYNSPKIFNKTI